VQPPPPSQATEKLVFEQTIEGLFVRGLRGQVSDTLKAKLMPEGLDLNKPLRPAYTFHTWMRCLQITAASLHHNVPLEDGLFRLGEAMIEGYGQTLVGRAILKMIAILGPRRTLMRATHNFRSGNNYTETKIIESSATSTALWMNEVGPCPTFTAGVIHAALRAAGVSPRVVIDQSDAQGCTFVCSWTAEPR
jgi:uncharacterized protein (TIGR02265 family)